MSLSLGILPFTGLHSGNEFFELAHGALAHVVSHVDGDIVGSRAFQVSKKSLFVFLGLGNLKVQKLVTNRLRGGLALHDSVVASSSFRDLGSGVSVLEIVSVAYSWNSHSVVVHLCSEALSRLDQAGGGGAGTSQILESYDL